MNCARLMGVVLSSLLLAPTAALAQEQVPEQVQKEVEEPNPGDRILKGHTFLFPVLQQSAFVTTHVGIREGVALFEAANVPLGPLGPRDAKLSGLQQTIDLGLRFTPWLGLYVNGQGSIILGVNGVSLLRRGVAFNAAADGGLVLRLLRREQSGTQLTLRAFGGVEKGRDVTILPLLQSLVDTPGRTLVSLFEGNAGDFLLVPTKENTLGAGLYLAQAVSRGFSLQLSSAARRTERTESPFDPLLAAPVDDKFRVFRWENAAALTYDFGAHGVPVALLGEYLFSLGHRSGGAGLLSGDVLSSTVAAGLYYSGRPNLQVGVTGVRLLDAEPLEGTTPEGTPAKSDKPKVSYAQLILRYVW